MLKIIKDVNEISNRTLYKWDKFRLGRIPSETSQKLILNSLAPVLKVTVKGNTSLVCSNLSNDSVLLNFDLLFERILMSSSKATIKLEFSRPVFAAGARIGVIGIDTPRVFSANIVAVDHNQNPFTATAINGKSTNDIDRSALFLGAVSGTKAPEIQSLEFSVNTDKFDRFAISSLFYMENNIR